MDFDTQLRRLDREATYQIVKALHELDDGQQQQQQVGTVRHDGVMHTMATPADPREWNMLTRRKEAKNRRKTRKVDAPTSDLAREIWNQVLEEDIMPLIEDLIFNDRVLLSSNIKGFQDVHI